MACEIPDAVKIVSVARAPPCDREGRWNDASSANHGDYSSLTARNSSAVELASFGATFTLFPRDMRIGKEADTLPCAQREGSMKG